MESETQLQRFYREGWMSVEHFPSIYPWMSEDERLRAGNRLYNDFYFSGIESTAIPDLLKPRVDGGQNKDMTEAQAIHLDNFLKALRVVPVEFFRVIQAIVLDDRNILFTQTNRSKQKQHFNHLVKQRLCWGLDRLSNYYNRRRRRRR